MRSDRRTSTLVGVLFIVGDIAGVPRRESRRLPNRRIGSNGPQGRAG